MPVSEEDMIVGTTDYFVTENKLNPSASFAEIQAFVKGYKTSGNIIITASEGGLRSVIVVEKTVMTDDQSNDVRRVMGMDYEVESDEEDASE